AGGDGGGVRARLPLRARDGEGAAGAGDAAHGYRSVTVSSSSRARPCRGLQMAAARPAGRHGAWRQVRETPGCPTKREARFLMLTVVSAPANGAIVEIGSFELSELQPTIHRADRDGVRG